MKLKSPVHLSGYFIFLTSFIVYYITLEPTTSFWDCSEFILSANKLEVNHPSGAPLFVLLGRIFTFLSYGDVQKIAWSINLMSGFFSALTILFLFHIIVLFSRKISTNKFQIIGGAIIGSLTFAFTDSFWFSAVEGEVYALSMFFLTTCFWAILKWEANFGEPENNRWILFIAILTGLGLGVHLLNLLIIPTITIIVYLKSKQASIKNILLSFFIGCGLLVIILYALIPVSMWFFSVSETLFINQFSLPLNSGLIFSVFFLGGVFASLIYYFQKLGKSKLVLAILSVALILTGFSVYTVNLIRSQADPPINFGEPDNIYSLTDYLNREQYPKRPLIYGENYNSVITGMEERETKDYDGDKYVKRNLPANYVYAPETCSVFPRLYSNSPAHEEAYKSWVNIQGKRVRVKNRSGQMQTLMIPTFTENFMFFLRFQVGHMFLRYFMWNFVGRQNDIQGRGEPTKGNWISGIKPIDELRVGSQKNQPEWMKTNRARNTYFFIPFLLGIIGAVFHFKKDKVSFYSALALFLLAGVGLVVYINEIPIVPRERDYVFVGAFMAFSIWIGFSFSGILSYLNQEFSSKFLAPVLFVLIILCCLVLILSQNFDDHNRSNRYAARDFATNILNSCPHNSILFTSGDNDTYPLLYCQEVEGIRQDVRIVVMPFLSANWFIDQLKSQKNDNDGLKMILQQNKIDEGTLDYVIIRDNIKRKVDFIEVLKLISGDKNPARVRTKNGDSLCVIPVTDLYFTVSANGKTGNIPISLSGKNALYKHELVFWDIVVSNAETRPICFVSKAEAQSHGLLNYLQSEGLVYRVVPEKNNVTSIMDTPKGDTEKLYNLFMKEFKWGNIDDPIVYVDYNTIYNANVFQLQNGFYSLAKELLNKGETEKAQNVAKKCISLFSRPEFLYNNYSLDLVDVLFSADLNDLGTDFLVGFVHSVQSNLGYYKKIKPEQRIWLKNEIMTEMYYFQRLQQLIQSNDLKDKFPGISKDFNFYAETFKNL